VSVLKLTSETRKFDLNIGRPQDAALGHKQTCAAPERMSALPRWQTTDWPEITFVSAAHPALATAKKHAGVNNEVNKWAVLQKRLALPALHS